MRDLFSLFYDCSAVSTDTRSITKESLFIALKGENFDGNKFALEAVGKGAKYAIVSNRKIANQSEKLFYVENTLIFLQKLAEFHRKKFNIPVIGITGSNGKTTTKELIASVLQQKYSILYTKGNLNNHIGVPLTLLHITSSHEIALIEMGASKVGDIKELTDIVHPTHGLITNIGKAHIGVFGNFENIIKTKTGLYRAVEKVKGHIFYNENDSILKSHLPSDCPYSTYAIGRKATEGILGELINLNPYLNFKWKNKDYTSPEINSRIIGKYNFYNMLAAICVGTYFKVEEDKINFALENYVPHNNRSQIKETSNNTLILDAYNANPTSVKSALDNFAAIKTDKNKLFILGDMLELGKDQKDYHLETIKQCQQLQLQGIYVGEIYKEISQTTEILAFLSTKEAKEFLKTAQPQKNLILLKGSRGIGLEKLMDVL